MAHFSVTNALARTQTHVASTGESSRRALERLSVHRRVNGLVGLSYHVGQAFYRAIGNLRSRELQTFLAMGPVPVAGKLVRSPFKGPLALEPVNDLNSDPSPTTRPRTHAG